MNKLLRAGLVLMLMSCQLATQTFGREGSPRPSSVYSQQPAELTVKGKVASSNSGEPLPGVSILLKGTTVGTVTDGNGQYSLTVADPNGTLIFSYIGMTTEEVLISNRSEINVALVPNLKTLSEVVVVGYGTQQRKDVTSSISSVKGKDFQNVPVASPDAMLQGRTSGVQVVQNTGSPGGGVSVKIRGTTSLNAGNSPLYVIDGVPINGRGLSPIGNVGTDGINALASINPNDIESMEILKDASATSIYGARGANGVILITTKRGKSGQASINLSTYTGFAQVRKKVDMLNGEQQRAYIVNAVENANKAVPAPNPPLTVRERVDTSTIDTDWQEELFRDAPVTNVDLAMRGGTDKTLYAVSLGYFNQQGVIINSGYKRMSGRLNLDYQATPKLKMGTSIALTGGVRNRIPEGDDPNAVLTEALRKLPFSNVYNPDGSYVLFDQIIRGNPVAIAKETEFKTQDNNLVANIFGEYEILKGLSLSSNLGIDFFGSKDDYFIPSILQNGSARPSRTGYSQNLLWTNENILRYSRIFNERHNLSALVGYSVQESRFQTIRAGANQGATDNIATLNSAAQPTDAYSFNSNWGLVSLFGRVNYAFKDRYLLAASVRRDGSSRLGANNKYDLFPSVSAGWRISEESFLKTLPFISDLKLRGSIGVVGNQQISNNDYASQGLYNSGSNYLGKPGIAPAAIPNPNLFWETTTQSDIAIDLALFNDRITFTADAYLKKTKDLLLNINLPSTSGFGSSLQNIGSTENRGVEFDFSSQNLVGAFTWRTNFNISFNRNKITSLSASGEDIFATAADAVFWSDRPVGIARVGQPIGLMYGYVYTGRVYATTEEAKAANMRENTPTGVLFQAGDMAYVDLNGDGVISATNDRTIIGNPNPIHTGGITNTFGYKGIELSVLMQWSYGNDIYNQTRQTLNRSFVYNAGTTELLRSWRQEGDETDVPRGTPTTIGRNGLPSTRWVEDGSYLRVKTATLSYSIPSRLLEKVRIKSLQIYGSGQNLFTFTRYSGLDPEVNFRSSQPLLQGIDLGTYPQTRTFIVGLNVGF